MTDQIRPEEAARALNEIGQRQEQVIRLVIIPTWYWWAIAILGFVAVTVGASLAIGFILKASGVSYAATISVSVTAMMLVVGGPMLMRYLQGLMLANRTGSRR
jgi:hypothetical protein